MTDFSKLDRADDWVYAVGRQVGMRAATVGLAAWNTSPDQAQARERAARLMGRAANRVTTQAGSLAASAGLPESAILAHLYRRNRARSMIRIPRPSGRASR